MAANLTIPEDYEPVISMDDEGIHLIGSTVPEKLKKKSLSASAVTALLTCPAKFIFSSFVERDVFDDSGSIEAKKGTLFHKVMEDFFALDKEERTKDRMKTLVNEVLMLDEFADMARDREMIAWLRDAVNGYYSMGAKPEKVDIAEITIDGKTKKGLEVFVKGKIGKASRETLGYIDRVAVDKKTGRGSLAIEDWKSGAKAKEWHIGKMSYGKPDDQGKGELRQQIIYTLLLRQKGFDVSAARLIFPVAEKIVHIDVDDQELIDMTIKDVEEADAVLGRSIENNTFEYGPSLSLIHI